MAKMSLIRKGILSLGLVSASLFGYEFNRAPDGIPEKWDKEELMCSVDASLGQEYKDAFFDSLNKWAAALDGMIKFVESDGSRHDIYMNKAFLDSKKVALAEWNRDDNGNMNSCKISLNSSKSFSRNTVDGETILNLDSVILHELGHALGLKNLYAGDIEKITAPHILHYDMPTMFDGYFDRRSQSVLHLDDIRGIRALYGLPEPAAETLFFDIEKVVNKRKHKDINLLKRLTRGWYEFSSPVGGQITVFNVDGDILPGNPMQWKLPRGYHIVTAEYRGRIGMKSFLIGREPKIETKR